MNPCGLSKTEEQDSLRDFQADERTQHTPGPWQIGGDYNSGRKDGQRIVIITAPHPDGGGQNIAECVERDARLIVAAPSLFTAAKCALADLEGIMPEFEPSGERNHPAWQTIRELRAAIGDAMTDRL